MRVESIQVGLPRTPGRPGATSAAEREWTTALYKETITAPVQVGTEGLDGDGQADLENHGGPDMAINAYPREHLAHWRETLALPFEPGAFGENFSTSGLAETGTCIGDRFRVGSALVEVSQPRQPCWKIARRWQVKDLALRVGRTGFSGWYFRVLEKGEIEAPEALELLDRPYPEWTIAAVNELRFRRTDDGKAALRLSRCPALSTTWREIFQSRASELGFG